MEFVRRLSRTYVRRLLAEHMAVQQLAEGGVDCYDSASVAAARRALQQHRAQEHAELVRRLCAGEHSAHYVVGSAAFGLPLESDVDVDMVVCVPAEVQRPVAYLEAVVQHHPRVWCSAVRGPEGRPDYATLRVEFGQPPAAPGVVLGEMLHTVEKVLSGAYVPVIKLELRVRWEVRNQRIHRTLAVDLDLQPALHERSPHWGARRAWSAAQLQPHATVQLTKWLVKRFGSSGAERAGSEATRVRQRALVEALQTLRRWGKAVHVTGNRAGLLPNVVWAVLLAVLPDSVRSEPRALLAATLALLLRREFDTAAWPAPLWLGDRAALPRTVAWGQLWSSSVMPIISPTQPMFNITHKVRQLHRDHVLAEAAAAAAALEAGRALPDAPLFFRCPRGCLDWMRPRWLYVCINAPYLPPHAQAQLRAAAEEEQQALRKSLCAAWEARQHELISWLPTRTTAVAVALASYVAPELRPLRDEASFKVYRHPPYMFVVMRFAARVPPHAQFYRAHVPGALLTMDAARRAACSKSVIVKRGAMRAYMARKNEIVTGKEPAVAAREQDYVYTTTGDGLHVVVRLGGHTPTLAEDGAATDFGAALRMVDRAVPKGARRA